ncbi:hypothetical protein F4X33_09310 [Candidatus Poribacteria bacterium]|nr:hypothetical protein [Candidatus Poribacteria bacterium]
MRNAIQNQPEQIIQNKLSAIQRRMRIEGVFQNLATFNLWGLLIAGILLIADRFFPLPIAIGFAIALPIVIASISAVGLTLMRKIDPFEVARFVDQRLNLKERLGTALEALDRRNAGDFAILQIRDAAQSVQEILPATVVSYTVPRTIKWFPIPMLLVGFSFFIPRMYEIPEQIIQNKLSAIQRRMRIEGVFQNLATFNLWGLLIAGILLIADRFFPLPIAIGFAIALPIVIASISAVGLTLMRKIDPFEVARFVDQRLNLKERLGTALEALDRRNAGDFAILQIRDAAQSVQEILPATVVSYTVPRTIKWFPIPMLLVGFSFFIPRMYEIPPPPTAAEHAAIQDAAARLEGVVSGSNRSELSKQVEETAKALRNSRAGGVQAAQEKLSKLREEVQAQKSQLAENELDQAVETISKLIENSNLLGGADAAQIASELRKLADQMDGLTEAERTELDALLRQLAEQLGDNPAAKNLVGQLNEIGTEGVSPEMLAKIARSLLEIDQQAKDIAQLEDILEEIKASRKNIGLAGIEMARKTGGVAGSDGGPGEESETGEARGTQVEAMPPETQPTAALQLRGATSEAEEFATASTQEAPSGEEEPTYMPYRKAYLNAKQTYAEAVERDRIPVRYRQRVKDYLDAIAKTSK